MLLAHSQSKKKDFIVDDKIFPQTLEVLLTRAEPLGINIVKVDVITVVYNSASSFLYIIYQIFYLF